MAPPRSTSCFDSGPGDRYARGMTRLLARFARFLPCFVLALLAIQQPNAAEPWPASTQQWHGFAKVELTVDGRTATVVLPRTPAPGRPWVWHGEFFGHRPEPDIALLGLGFHLLEFFWKNAGPAVVGRTPEERAAGLRLPAILLPAAKP